MCEDLCLRCWLVAVLFLVACRAESEVVLSFARNDSFFTNSAYCSKVACDLLSSLCEPANRDHL